VQHGPRVVAIASGKGGVGKSLIAANVGIFLATLGKRVVLVDACFGAANLHIFAGVARPLRSLHEAFVSASGSSSGSSSGPAPVPLRDLAVASHVPNLRIIASVFDPPSAAEPSMEHITSLAKKLRELPADWVVVDLPPGTSRTTLELFLQADIGVIAAVPDPTSIELLHRFLRAAFLHRLRQLGLGAWNRSEQAPSSLEGGAESALDIYRRALAEGNGADLPALRSAILSFAPHLVINSVRSKSDMEMGRAVTSAARRRLGVPLHYLGHLEYDEAVWASTRRRRPVLVEHPETRIAKCFERVTRALIATRPPDLDGEVLPSENHYDLLEVPPTASFEDIRRANRRVRDIYGAESVMMSGLYDAASLEAVHRRFDLAYTTLMDAAKRKDYDMELFPDGIPTPPPSEHGHAPPRQPPPKVEDAIAAVRPPMPELLADTEYSGALLRQIREARGIELREIAERSKVSMAYLQALEAEAYTKLPAAVYVRGFLVEYAKVLGLDVERVKDTYLLRLRTLQVVPEDDGDAPRRSGG
jgi:flagellar biosynthesis protein FlhG